MMHHKIGSLWCLATALIVLPSCSVDKLARLDQVSPNEAIAVARFRVIYNGEKVTKNNYVYFNSTYGGEHAFKDDEYMFFKLPAGKNNIQNVCHSLVQHHFEPDELTFNLAGGGTINYLGDITFVWDGMNSAGATGMALLSPIASMYLTGGGTKVSVESHPASARDALRQRYGVDRVVTPSLLKVKTRHQ